jgi:hypothetical protein
LFFVFQTKFHIVASTVCTFHSSMLYCVQIVTGNALFRKKTLLFTIQVGVLLTVRATCVTRRGTSRMKNKAKSITEHRHLCVIHCFCSKRQYRRNYGKLNSASHVSYVEYARASKKTELIIHTSANNPWTMLSRWEPRVYTVYEMQRPRTRQQCITCTSMFGIYATFAQDWLIQPHNLSFSRIK